jgi:holliday junction DNA helicase RuvB
MMDNLSASPSSRVLSSAALPEEPEGLDVALRPQSLEDFIGQEGLRANILVFIGSAKARGVPLDHVLLHGPPGLGKTTLAQIIARELGVNFRATSGPMLSKAGDVAALLTNVQEGDVLFIDEIHRLNTQVEEVLYSAMEDFHLDIIIGEGPAARSLRLALKPFTLVGATTRAGLLTNPLRDRFGIPLRLEFYAVEELKKIILRAAVKMALTLTEQAAGEIAARSRGTPRIAGRLLRRVRDFAVVEQKESVNHDDVHRVLQRLDVDSLGLDTMDRRYLKSLAEYYGGGPVGIETLAAVLSEARDTLEDIIEPYLLQQGFLQRTARGRMLTAKSYQHLGLPVPTALLLQAPEDERA